MWVAQAFGNYTAYKREVNLVTDTNTVTVDTQPLHFAHSLNF